MCQMIDKHIPDSVDIITPYPKKDELQCYYLGPSINGTEPSWERQMLLDKCYNTATAVEQVVACALAT